MVNFLIITYNFAITISNRAEGRAEDGGRDPSGLEPLPKVF